MELRRRWFARGALVTAAVLAASGCGTSATATTPAKKGTISVVAAENQYGNVASQIGGRFVSVTSVESNPNTDPHSYEVSSDVAKAVRSAQVVVQNGVGYDDFMTKIESASTSSSRHVVNVQHLLGLPDSTPNPHLWYSPRTMPKVAATLAADFAKLQPANAAFFQANAAKFVASLQPWLNALAQFKTAHPDTPVATTEPVSDYMLQAAGTDNLTPFGLQADIMNGVDPSPQNVAVQTGLFSDHRVRVFVYNQQVTDSLTQSFISAAKKARVPIVGVYETMPSGFSYQSWMVAEVGALSKAVAHGVSTEKL